MLEKVSECWGLCNVIYEVNCNFIVLLIRAKVGRKSQREAVTDWLTDLSVKDSKGKWSALV